jgi:CubicO group peptidase (beta-lactamase class C family)
MKDSVKKLFIQGKSNALNLVRSTPRLTMAFTILLMVMARPRVPAQPSLNVKYDSPIVQKYRQLIPQLMAEQNIPGLAVAVADENGVVWSQGFGYTDTDHKKAVNSDTIFSVQSNSKNFTAMSILLAVQDSLLDLDAPITTYLPDFTVHSIFEEHPERKITLRMLLSHTAGFTHEAPLGNNFDLGHVPFEEHIKTISDTWLRFPVGTGYAYSNLGISLAGYILQKVSGQPFARYVQDKLLLPLGMTNSSFDMAQIRANPNRAVGHSAPLPKVPLEIPIIPEGGLYTSANDMAKYIQYHLNQGSVNGQSVISPALLDEMYTASTQNGREGYGLGVARTTWFKGRNAELLCHGGGGFGFLSDLWWLPELKIGITVLTNADQHNLQGDLALQILYDFVNDPNRVYYSRLMALPESAPVVEGNGQFRPPLGLEYEIEGHAQQSSAQDRLRWREYVGDYSVKTWGVVDPTQALGQVYQPGSDLYLKISEPADDLRLMEVSPGLFFAENGEALDFRGDVPTWRNIKLIRIGKGASTLQQAVLAACGLVFLSGLIMPPLRGIIRRFRRAKPAGMAASRWAHVASAFAILASFFGLLSIIILVAFPKIIYSGFLGWLELPLWQKLLLHAPFAFLVTVIGFLALNVPAWKNRWWSRGERVYYLAFGLASVAVVLLLSFWHLIGLSLR